MAEAEPSMRRELRFAGFSLRVDDAELWRGDRLVPVEPQVFDLILFLAENPDRLVTRDEIVDRVWRGRIVSEAAIASRINAARSALGDDGKAQRVIRTAPKRGFRFLPEVETVEPDDASREPSAPEPASAPLDIRYVATPGGVNLAYARQGEGEIILKTASFLNHLEHEVTSPVWRHWVRELSSRATYIRYDQRGGGLSDWDVAEISFAAFVRDLETVMDALALERVTLFGVSQGASIAVEYARRHPERVKRLILVGGYPAGWRRLGLGDFAARREALLSLVRAGWGMDNPAFRQPYTSMFFPEGSPEIEGWFNDLQRVSATPENAYRILDAIAEIDVRDALGEISAPTLVMHSVGDQMVPFAASKTLAARIPGARLQPLDCANHIVLETDPAWPVAVETIRRFVSETAPKP